VQLDDSPRMAEKITTDGQNTGGSHEARVAPPPGIAATSTRGGDSNAANVTRYELRVAGH